MTIAATGYGEFGAVVETLPNGFSYQSSSLDAADVQVDGQVITFSLLEEELSFTYDVDVSDSATSGTFRGIVKNDDRMESIITGDSRVTVDIPTFSATRSFDPKSLPAEGGSVTVTITPVMYGGFGLVEETLPAGFIYVSSSLTEDDVSVDTSGTRHIVSFTLVSATFDFSYVVNAPPADAVLSFTGVFRNADREQVTIGGDSQITVGTPPAPRPPTTGRRAPDPTRTGPLRSTKVAVPRGQSPRTPPVVPLLATPSPPATVITTSSHTSSELQSTNSRSTGPLVK